MSGQLDRILNSSVFRKQMVAVTGLAMIGFVIGHLSGNLLIFAGAEAFNGYAHKLASLGPLLWVARLGLIACVFLHMYFIVKLAIENAQARPERYNVLADHGDRKFATKTMRVSGVVIVLFIILHLIDFTFGDKVGVKSVIAGVNNDESLELYGLVWNSFHVWWRDLFYILAVSSVGMHLTHAIQSVFQTFGFNHERYTPLVQKLSVAVGVVVAMVFSSIPIIVFFSSKPPGV